MIKRLICSPNLLIANGLNSFAKTLVLSLWIDLLSFSSFLMHLHLVLCYVLFNMFLFVCFQFCFILFFHNKKNWKTKIYKNSVCFVYIGTCVPWMAIETKFSKLCIISTLDEHLYAQLSKWALQLLFVMSKIELSLIPNTHIILFWRKGLKNPKRKALITISPLFPANHVRHLYAST